MNQTLKSIQKVLENSDGFSDNKKAQYIIEKIESIEDTEKRFKNLKNTRKLGAYLSTTLNLLIILEYCQSVWLEKEKIEAYMLLLVGGASFLTIIVGVYSAKSGVMKERTLRQVNEVLSEINELNQK